MQTPLQISVRNVDDSDAARAALIEGTGVAEARVRLACTEALGSFYRDEKVASQLEKLIGNDQAYGVRAAAVTSLVKIRGERASRVCVDALKQESDVAIVRNISRRLYPLTTNSVASASSNSG